MGALGSLSSGLEVHGNCLEPHVMLSGVSQGNLIHVSTASSDGLTGACGY